MVAGEDLTISRQTDLGNAMAGKVSGARFIGGASSGFDAGTIILRGAGSIPSSSQSDNPANEPIYVVDGAITNKNSINMDDVESINVLKGPAATALYGSRGGAGAIIITTKAGQSEKGLLEVSHTLQAETYYNHFNMQKLYGGGGYGGTEKGNRAQDIYDLYSGDIPGLLGVASLIIIAPYRMQRIVSFLNPWNDPLGSGFQIIQSLYAIGPGGLLGLGFGNSIQKHFYLPEPQTDFIFSIISEEFGFMGVLLVTTLFLMIIISGFKIAMKCEDSFGKYLAFGITFGLSFQTMLNLMVVVGLIPVTGVTLPFLSYGGSSLLITMCSMGILLNISSQNK